MGRVVNPYRRRRKWGYLRSYYIRILLATRSPEQVVRWLQTWLKAGEERQMKMEIALFDDNKL